MIASGKENPWDIRIEHLDGGYGQRLVLSDFSATLPGACISAILGESGGGKTTLLRILLGLTPPAGGNIYLGGRDVFALSARQFHKLRRRFGVLFQDGALIGSLTLAENVALPLREHTTLPLSTLRQAALRALDLVNLADFADYYPSELSGGMRKRAGLARAIITEPPLLFCDEPTSGLDPITAAQMDQLLLDMKQHYPDMTTVIITHDMGSVIHTAQSVLMLKDGRSLYNGPLDGLMNHEDPYIRQFLDRKAEESRRMTAPPLDEAVRGALAGWLEQ